LQYSGGVLHYLAFSVPDAQMTHTCGSWAFAEESVLSLQSLCLEHGSTVQIRSGKQEILGAMVAMFPRGKQTEEDLALMEGLSGIARIAIEDARLHDQLAHQAHHDVLTGLPNRLLVESELESALQEAAEGGQSLALVFLDIDRFKHINDSLGHLVGDAFLTQVAARLIQSIPVGAMAARVGGDEFTVILKHQDGKAEVERSILRIVDELRTPLTVAGNRLHPSFSLGVSMFPQDGTDAVTLQRRADLALYRAKSGGKNRYEFFSQDIGDSAVEAMAMEQVLHMALDDDWLELHFQAQFTQAGELAGLEALVRLRHPMFGLVGPAIFIALAEETGLIHRLGEWVLRETCRQIRRWQTAGFEPVKIAVNVSALQFRQPGFAESVGEILDEMRIDPRLIELELTESMIMGDYEESARQMHKLRNLGVSIAVDDFGTGHCSLAHLHRLPIDVLKIDQSFIRGIDSQSRTWPLVQAIVGLAHNLSLSVVAEGVETECQRLALVEIDCDCLQGFGLHRPQPAVDIEQVLLPQTSARRTPSVTEEVFSFHR
jgi:diguanylate cyclase (GGDEF)-like protein